MGYTQCRQDTGQQYIPIRRDQYDFCYDFFIVNLNILRKHSIGLWIETPWYMTSLWWLQELREHLYELIAESSLL